MDFFRLRALSQAVGDWNLHFQPLFGLWKLHKSESQTEREEMGMGIGTILLPSEGCLPGRGRPGGFTPKDLECILPCGVSSNKTVLGAWTGIYPFQPSVVTTRLKSYAYISVPSPRPNKTWIPFLKIFRKASVRSAPSLPLKIKSLSRDRKQHLGVEVSCKIPIEGSCSEMLYKLDSYSATFAPLYNSPNQDLGSEIVECFENMELDSDPDLNFLVVACLPSVCIWMSHRI